MTDRVPAQPQPRPNRRHRRPNDQRRGQNPNRKQAKPTTSPSTQRAADYPSYPWANPELARSRKEHETSDYWAFEPKHISTYAGSGRFGHDDGDLNAAAFVQPQCALFTFDGTMFVSERRHRIRMITSDGTVTTFAGTHMPGCVDGPRLEARFHRPNGICLDANGHIIVCDTNNAKIRRIDMDTDMVSTLAGTDKQGLTDGPCNIAQFLRPNSIVIGPDTSLYVSDSIQRPIRRILNGMVTTLDLIAPPHVPRFIPIAEPTSIALHPITGIMYVAQHLASGIVRLTTVDLSTGLVAELPYAPNGKSSHGPCTLGFTPSGSLIVSDAYFNHLYRQVGLEFVHFAGSGQRTCHNGHMSEGSFSPAGFTFSNDGIDFYLCDLDGHRIRKICAPFEDPQMISLQGSLEPLLGALNPSNPSSDVDTSKFIIGETEVVKHSNREWKLLTAVMRRVAPFLCTASGKQELEKIKCPSFVIDLFLKVLHGVSLERAFSETSTVMGGEGVDLDASHLSVLCDLYMVSRLMGVPALSKCCFHEMKKEIVNRVSMTSAHADLTESLISRFGYHRGKKSELRASHKPSEFCTELLTLIISFLIEQGNYPVTSLESILSTGHHANDTLHLLRTVANGAVDTNTADADFLFSHRAIAHLIASMDPQEEHAEEKEVPAPNFILETEERTFEVHDWILFSRWPFFARALQFGGHELKSRKISFTDDILTADALSLLLRFIYSRHTPSLPNARDYEDDEAYLHREHTEIIFDACDCLVENSEFLGLSKTDWTTFEPNNFHPFATACRAVLLTAGDALSDRERQAQWRASAADMWWKAKWSKLVDPSPAQ